MLYRCLNTTELERAAYIDPANAAAHAELLRRVPELMDQEDEALADARAALEIEQQERSAEVNCLQEDLEAAEAHAAELQRDLDAATDRIRDLTATAAL